MNRKNRNSIASCLKLPQFITMNVIDGQAGLVRYYSLIFYSLTINNILNIIVLLILAGITVSTLTNSGLLDKSKQAVSDTKLARYYEDIKMEIDLAMVEYYSGNTNVFSDILILLLEKKGYNIESKIETNGIGILELETADGYIIIINIDNNIPKATIDMEESGKANYDATITYNANSSDITAETVTQPARTGHNAKLKTNIYTREKYIITGWSLTAGGAAIENNTIVNIEGDVTVYAIWAKIYTVNFDANGGEGTMEPVNVIEGQTLKLPANIFTNINEQYIFTGWKQNSNIYTDKQEITVNSDLTLVAQWEDGWIITLNSNNGSGQTQKVGVKKGNQIALPDNIYTNENKYFYRWNTEVDGSGVEYRNNSNIKPTENMTLYAQYVEAKAGDSLLGAIKNNTFTNDSIQYIAVNNEIYSIHIYVFDEDKTISANDVFGNENDVATNTRDATNMIVIKANKNLTIPNGVKLTTYASTTNYGGPKGLLIYCNETLTNNSEISMTARGAKAEGENVYLWKNSDGSYEYIPASSATTVVGTNRKTGNGGIGGRNTYGSGCNSSVGTSYSGGSGGGGSQQNCGSVGGNAMPNGGAGGYGSGGGSGGAGNPGGSGRWNGESGTGGLLIIYANTFSNNGTIVSNGKNGGYTDNHGAGGGSGGGSINIFYNNISSFGTINANGGSGGGSKNRYCANAGNGGSGTKNIGSISTGSYIPYSE